MLVYWPIVRVLGVLFGLQLIFLFAVREGLCGEKDSQPTHSSRRLISFPSGKTKLSVLLKQFEEQTGVQVRDARAGSDPELVVNLKEVTFWKALDTLARESGARVDLYRRDGTIALVAQPEGYRHPPTSYSGMFRTTLKSLRSTYDWESNSSSSKAILEVAWHPRLQPFFVQTRPQGLRLRGAGDRDLSVAPLGSAQGAVSGKLTTQIEVDLPRALERIGLLRGGLSVVGPSKMLTFSFASLQKLKDQPEERRKTLEGVECTVTPLSLSRSLWAVRVMALYPKGNYKLDTSQAQVWVESNPFELVSVDGKRKLSTDHFIVLNPSSRRIQVTYYFRGKQIRGQPADWAVRYQTPARIVQIPFRFSFKDVALPPLPKRSR